MLEKWISKTPWVDFLAAEPSQRSSTSICLKIIAPWFNALAAEDQVKITKKMTSLLDEEEVAYDIDGYRNAPPGLRVWGGATVETSDLEALTPWLDWAYNSVCPD